MSLIVVMNVAGPCGHHAFALYHARVYAIAQSAKPLAIGSDYAPGVDAKTRLNKTFTCLGGERCFG